MEAGFSLLVLIVGFVLWIVMLMAQIRLFSIDDTLKKILRRLDQLAPPETTTAPNSERSLPAAVVMIDREVSECTNCHYQVSSSDPGRCANCGNKKWDRKLVKVPAAQT